MNNGLSGTWSDKTVPVESQGVDLTNAASATMPRPG